MSVIRPQSNGVRKNSTNLYFHRYLCAHKWTKLLAKDVPMPEKCSMITETALQAGQPFPNEMTVVHWVSMLIYAQHGIDSQEPMQINPMDAKQLNQQLKDMLKAKRTHRAANAFDAAITSYPPDPATLKDTHPGWFEVMYPGYTTHPELLPAACPLNEAILEQIRVRLPARSTHSSVNQQAFSMTKYVPRNGQNMQQILQTVAALMAGQARSPDGEVPGLRILKEPGSSCCGMPSTLEKGTSSMTLSYAPQMPALMAPTTPMSGAQRCPSTFELGADILAGLEPIKSDASVAGTDGALPGLQGSAEKPEPGTEQIVNEMLGKLGKGTDLAGNPTTGRGRGRGRGRGSGRSGFALGLKDTCKAKKVIKAIQVKVPTVKGAKLKLPFPGVPKKPVEAQSFGKFRIYTAWKQQSWRVLRTEVLRGIPLRSASSLKNKCSYKLCCFKKCEFITLKKQTEWISNTNYVLYFKNVTTAIVNKNIIGGAIKE